MWTRALALTLLLAAAFAARAEEEGQLALGLKEAKPAPRRYDLGLELELRAQSDLRDRPETRSRQSLHEVAVSGGYTFDETTAVHLELAVEQLDNRSTLFARQAYIDWMPLGAYGRARLGQQYLPVGLINERHNLYSSNPPFLRRLLTADQAIDLGAVARLNPLASDLAFVEAGAFAGRLVRPTDARDAAPDRAPYVVSLKSESELHRAFVSYFEHDLAFYDPMKAVGLGFELRAPQRWPVRPSLMAEHWRLRETQTAGPDQFDRAWLVAGELEWWRLRLGVRWSESHGEVKSLDDTLTLPLESSRLYWLEAALVPEVRLRLERVMETQSEVLRDEWVGRALVDWTYR